MEEIVDELLRDEHLNSTRHHYIRSTCALALGLSGSQRAVEPLTRMLTDPDRWVRPTAVEALCALDAERMTALLLEQSHHRLRNRRKEAAEGLRHLLRPEVRERLCEMMRTDRVHAVRAAAAQALAAQGDFVSLEWPARGRGFIRELTLCFIRRKDNENLIKLRCHPNPAVRRQFIDAFVDRRRLRPCGRPHLRILLADPDPEVRMSAACKLARQEPSLVLEFTLDLLASGKAPDLLRLVTEQPSYAAIPAIQSYLWSLSAQNPSMVSERASFLLQQHYGIPRGAQ